MSPDVEELRLELQDAREEIDATEQGECGHNWDRRIWEEGCPVCAMKDGVAVRIGDLEAENVRLREALEKIADGSHSDEQAHQG